MGTGEILALVNQPSYNPNDTLQAGLAGMRNRAVTDVYEPGSTVKPFTVMAALESGLFRPDTIIDTSPGYVGIRGKLIEDPLNRGRITLTRALHKSSQVGFAKVALELPPRAVHDVLRRRAGAGDFRQQRPAGRDHGDISMTRGCIIPWSGRPWHSAMA